MTTIGFWALMLFFVVLIIRAVRYDIRKSAEYVVVEYKAPLPALVDDPSLDPDFQAGWLAHNNNKPKRANPHCPLINKRSWYNWNDGWSTADEMEFSEMTGVA